MRARLGLQKRDPKDTIHGLIRRQIGMIAEDSYSTFTNTPLF